MSSTDTLKCSSLTLVAESELDSSDSVEMVEAPAKSKSWVCAIFFLIRELVGDLLVRGPRDCDTPSSEEDLGELKSDKNELVDSEEEELEERARILTGLVGELRGFDKDDEDDDDWHCCCCNDC